MKDDNDNNLDKFASIEKDMQKLWKVLWGPSNTLEYIVFDGHIPLWSHIEVSDLHEFLLEREKDNQLTHEPISEDLGSGFGDITFCGTCPLRCIGEFSRKLLVNAFYLFIYM